MMDERSVRRVPLEFLKFWEEANVFFKFLKHNLEQTNTVKLTDLGPDGVTCFFILEVLRCLSISIAVK